MPYSKRKKSLQKINQNHYRKRWPCSAISAWNNSNDYIHGPHDRPIDQRRKRQQLQNQRIFQLSPNIRTFHYTLEH